MKAAPGRLHALRAFQVAGADVEFVDFPVEGREADVQCLRGLFLVEPVLLQHFKDMPALVEAHGVAEIVRGDEGGFMFAMSNFCSRSFVSKGFSISQ